MLGTSTKGRQKILRLRYHCLKEYDLEGERVDTDEFIYDSDVSVEDRVQVPRLGKTWSTTPSKSHAKRDNPPTTVGVEEPALVGPAEKALRSTLYQSRTARHWSPANLPAPAAIARAKSESRDVVPNPDIPSVENRKIEEVNELPIFADDGFTAIGKYV